MRRITIFCLVLVTFSCAPQKLSYKEALDIARGQERQYRSVFEQADVFLDCFGDLIENFCSGIKDQPYDKTSLIVEFDRLGSIVETYYTGRSKFSICLSEAIIDNTCSNPPVDRLFLELKFESSED